MKSFVRISLYIMVWMALFCISADADPYSGLWIGQIEVNKVNEVTSQDTEPVKDVKHPYDLRILLHVDAAGQVRLLRDVTIMQKRYIVEEDGERKEMVRRVLITDDARLPEYEGVISRDDKMVGIRLGSTTTEFEPNQNELLMTGTFSPENTVSGVMNLSKDHPSNPFRHKFHKDHQTGFDITRNVTLTFAPLTENREPEDGVSKLKGKYQETITGLHAIQIKLEGTFAIEKVSVIDTLNE